MGARYTPSGSVRQHVGRRICAPNGRAGAGDGLQETSKARIERELALFTS